MTSDDSPVAYRSFSAPPFYLITDRRKTAGRPFCDVIREAGEAGVRAVQFREKDLSLREQLELAGEIQKITRSYGMRLFINDRVDLCRAIDADGVHLPSTGLPIPVARILLGPQKGIGISCHTLDDVLRAQAEGADFALLGPVYDTPSKRAYGPPLGIGAFRKIKEATSLPVYAIGGIDEKTVAEVLQAGADGVALISAIMEAQNVYETCKTILNILSTFFGSDSPSAPQRRGEEGS